MTAKQTRRSVSVKGVTYAKLREYCDAVGASMSEVVEAALTYRLHNGPVQTVKLKPVVSIPGPTPADGKTRPMGMAAELFGGGG